MIIAIKNRVVSTPFYDILIKEKVLKSKIIICVEIKYPETK